MTQPTSSRRPPLSTALHSREFQRWYWLKTELQDFARVAGISTGGGKADLTERIAAVLDGRPVPQPVRARQQSKQLKGLVNRTTVIPAGQRCSQLLRVWFEVEIGTAFHFDAHMREFIAAADGTTTLGDAVEHWRATREGSLRAIGGQFEFNRFTRWWHASHLGGDRRELLEAWQRYRSLPTDERRRI